MFFKKRKEAKRIAKERQELLEHHLTVDGHKIYAFKNIDHITKFRQMALLLAYQQFDLGAKVSDLEAFTTMLDQALSKGDIGAIGWLNNNLKAQLSLYSDRRRILAMGSCCILVDNEPIHELSDKHNKIKEKLIDSSQEVFAFFLNQGIGSLAKLNNKIDTSLIEEYLKEPRMYQTELTFLKSIGLTFSKDLTKDLMMKSFG